MNDRLVTIANFSTPAEAYFIQARLDDAGIPCTVIVDSVAGLNLTGSAGGARIQIHASNVERAAEILDVKRAPKFSDEAPE